MSDGRLFETTVSDEVCRLLRPGTRWLSSGWDGGESVGPTAYNVTVPEGWPETDLAAYVDTRLTDAGFERSGPTLLTGVGQEHARRARLDAVEVVATAGISNPAVLPVDDAMAADATTDDVTADDATADDVTADDATADGAGPGTETVDDPTHTDDPDGPVGTVNVLVGTTASLAPGALPNLLTVAAEAKAATLLAVAGAPGTTSDAVVAACNPDGPREPFSGSATSVGRAARACVRDAVLASLTSRYGTEGVPSIDTAPYGVVTDVRADVTRL